MNTNLEKIAGIDFGELEKVAVPNFQGADLGQIVSTLIIYLFPFAGILLLLYLIYGGYLLLLSRGDPKSVAAGKGVLTNAFYGFLLVFSAFWIVQLVGFILGIEDILLIF